jgi:hypothetical protein
MKSAIVPGWTGWRNNPLHFSQSSEAFSIREKWEERLWIFPQQISLPIKVVIIDL